jgi:hypothetical protein
METSIEILSSSLQSLEGQPPQSSFLSIYARLNVANLTPEDLPFDVVTISLLGAVTTKISGRAGIEKVSPERICRVAAH